MKQPKERLKEIYDEYLNWKENNKGRHFYQYLTSNKFLFVYTTLEVIKELTTHCGFSTTSECRKAINELESTTVTLPITGEKRQYDILSDSKTEFSDEEIGEAWKRVAEQMGGYKEETWQDILDEFAKFGKGKLGDWLIENFKTPERL